MMYDYELEELAKAMDDRCREIGNILSLGYVHTRGEYANMTEDLSETVRELVCIARDFCDGADVPDAMDWAEGTAADPEFEEENESEE